VPFQLWATSLEVPAPVAISSNFKARQLLCFLTGFRGGGLFIARDSRFSGLNPFNLATAP